MPKVNRRIRLGPAWATEAARLKTVGLNTAAIAETMGIGWRAVAVLLSSSEGGSKVAVTTTPKRGDGPNPEQLHEWRAEWTRLLGRVPDHGRNAARLLNTALYKRLRRWDRDWLYAKAPIRPLRQTSTRSDWVARDSEWAVRIVDAARKVVETLPLRRATTESVLKEALLSGTVRRNLGRLPECQAALDRHTESVDDFRERRLRAVAKRMRYEGMRCDLPRLKSAASLYVKLSPRLTAVLRECALGEEGVITYMNADPRESEE